MNLPTLFIKTATGAIQQWTVKSDVIQEGHSPIKGAVFTEYGQVNGKLQTTIDVIKTGKNLGKANETTPAEQAALKAKQMWDKKLKEGYIQDLSLAAVGETNLPGIEPMLAFPIEKKEKHVTFPAWSQPKLDGFRCIAVIENGKARLYSRTRKEVLTVPHIVKELERIFHDVNIILDGELYNHLLKHDFPRLASIIKRDEIHPDHTLIQFHCYDVAGKGSFEERFKNAWTRVLNCHEKCNETIQIIKTDFVQSQEELEENFATYLADNYEGAMYRSLNMPYENKRSAGLLKVKTMEDAEFEIVGVEEGNGKLMGKAGAFVCINKEGKEFKAKMKGALESLTEYLVNFDKYKGRQLTVQFQGVSPDNIPRFPVGLRIREEI